MYTDFEHTILSSGKVVIAQLLLYVLNFHCKYMMHLHTHRVYFMSNNKNNDNFEY